MLYTLFVEEIMDDIYEISMLLDFYGQLITERQFEILDLHYNNDFSLGEIAQQLSISRQGVFDNIKKGKAALNEMEDKLKLVSRFIARRDKALEISEQLKSIDISGMNKQDTERLKQAEQALQYLLED